MAASATTLLVAVGLVATASMTGAKLAMMSTEKWQMICLVCQHLFPAMVAFWLLARLKTMASTPLTQGALVLTNGVEVLGSNLAVMLMEKQQVIGLVIWHLFPVAAAFCLSARLLKMMALAALTPATLLHLGLHAEQ